MSNYTFTFKKDDIFAEFSSTDKEVVEKQFQIWVNNASEYTKSKEQQDAQEKPKEKIKAKPKEELQPKEEKTEAPSPADSVAKKKAKSKTEAKAEKLQEETEPLEDKKPEVEEQEASTTINEIQTKEEAGTEETAPSVDFDAILEDSMENSTFEPKRSKDGKFLQVISLKDPKDKFNHFIITAYYLLEHEKMQRFTLKQINAKLMQNLSTVVDHTVLQDAINSEFVEIVPDLTGISEVSEYRLTEKGEEFYQKL